MTTYRVHGLLIASQIPLPELAAHAMSAASRPDAVIELGEVPASLDGGIETVDGVIVAGDALLIEIEDVGRFLVEDARLITIAPEPGASDAVVRAFLYGAGLSMLLQQLALMPVHASGAVIGDAARLFLGPSGQGKSTLAAALSRRGRRLIADDKVVIRAGPSRPTVWPGVPTLSLSTASAVACARDEAERVIAEEEFGKHLYLVPDQFAARPAPVAAIYVLDWAEPGAGAPELSRLAPFEALVELRQNLNHGSLVAPLGLEADFAAWAEDIIAAVPLYRLRRPRDLPSLDAVVDVVLAHEPGND